MRVSGGAQFPYNMAYGAAAIWTPRAMKGSPTAREARAIGIHWIFAPVADVNNNPENPVINIRSYGENADDVAQHVAAYIDGAHSDPKESRAGDRETFSRPRRHRYRQPPGAGESDRDQGALETLEFTPFRAAIAHGVDSIMTAHLSVPALEPDEIPATVSSKVLTGVLRDELKFQNIIVTDAHGYGRAHANIQSGRGRRARDSTPERTCC